MKKVILLTTTVLILMRVGLPTQSYCAILFEDNFDSHPDWLPPQGKYPNSIEYWPAHKVADAPPPPDGYFCYRVAGSKFTDSAPNTLRIDSTNHRGPSGKGLTVWNESDNRGWASDGILGILLDQNSNGYEEIFVRFYIKFQPGWKWTTTSSPMQKFFGASHYIKGDSNPFKVFDFGSSHPGFCGNLAKWGDGTYPIAYYASYRFENAYYPSDATPPYVNSSSHYFSDRVGNKKDFWDTGMMGDANWHCWEFNLKMNSQIGYPDGEHRFWCDGILIAEVKDLAWSDETSVVIGSDRLDYSCILRHTSADINRPITGADWQKYWKPNGSNGKGKEWKTGEVYGFSTSNPRSLWNYVRIGGNNANHYAPNEEEAEQWHAIDDLVISTEYIGPANQKPEPPKDLRIIKISPNP